MRKINRNKDVEKDVVVSFVACNDPAKRLHGIGATTLTTAKATASRLGYQYVLRKEIIYKANSLDVIGVIYSHYKKTEKGWICTDNNVAANPNCPLLKFMDME